MAVKLPTGRVILYDDDHHYLGGVLAELLIQQGCEVRLVTPAPMISYWSQYTLEQERILKRLVGLGVVCQIQHTLKSIQSEAVTVSDSITNDEHELACDAVVLVSDRLPEDSLYQSLKPALADGRLASLRVIGDAEAPNIIARAIFSGYLAASEFDEAPSEETPFRVEYPAL